MYLDSVKHPRAAGELHNFLLDGGKEGGAGAETDPRHVIPVLPHGHQLQPQEVEGSGGDTLLLLGGWTSASTIQTLPYLCEKLVK